MFVVNRFRVGDEGEFTAGAHAALRALGACPGYLRGRLGRAPDDPELWCLVTEWQSVGAYRRALSAYDVKLYATPLLARAIEEPSAFEPLAVLDSGGNLTIAASDRVDPGSRGSRRAAGGA